MKHAKYLFTILLIIVAGMYGWHLMANAINNHADVAATVIIQDTLESSSAYDIGRLRELERYILAKQTAEATALINELIENKLFSLEQCVTDKCNEVNRELQP